jgi:hypothetical protein
MLEGFGLHPHERGGTPAPFGAMPDANGESLSAVRTGRRRVGSDARVERRDAVREGRHAPAVPSDAPPVAPSGSPAPPDAPPAPCHALPILSNAPRIRSEAVRRRRRHSRRVMRSTRTSLGDLPGVDHAAAELRACRPIPRERGQVLRKLCGARDDALRIRRDAQGVPRDAERGEDDAYGEAQKPAP